jgi:metal-responsive CopG/Arc/MetJ family transcriptional regulator
MARGKTTGELIGVRCQAELVTAIDEWRREQSDLPNRPEAMRRLIEQALKMKPERHRKRRDSA